jgi:UDP-4-amino-4,6-dideoxy-N-acetyl-beta-L-altrosamine transaminase
MVISYGRQDITPEDIEAVTRVLNSDFLTQGPVVPAFEAAVTGKTGAAHAVAVNSATSALHIACIALGLGKGDWLWTVPNTFVASSNCALYCGAAVDFVDIDCDTWNLSVARLEEKLAIAARENRLPKIVVSVHFGGQPTEEEAIWRLAKRYDFKVIEDASHSIGGSRNGEPVGSCRWADITVLSFHPVKIITSGEGGMALTNDDTLARTLQMLRSHGITRNVAEFKGASNGPWYYEQQTLGYNYRLTDIHAALGLSQIDRLESYVERRNQLARRYDKDLSYLPLVSQKILAGNISAYHLYVVRLMSGKTKCSRLELAQALSDRGIRVNLHYPPVHLQPYYREMGFEAGQFPEAEAYGNEAITLPLYPALSDVQQEEIIAALRELL